MHDPAKEPFLVQVHRKVQVSGNIGFHYSWETVQGYATRKERDAGLREWEEMFPDGHYRKSYYVNPIARME